MNKECGIFSNTKFGDKFRTRDGRMALYISEELGVHFLYVEGEDELDEFDHHGLFYDSYGGKLTSFDIIDKWQEPINEEELDRLAEEENPNVPDGDSYEVGQYFGFNDGFKAGYHKALEDK